MKKLSKEYPIPSKRSFDDQALGVLYVIATPIGNFEDISLRALKLLSLVDILLCEDTRRTKKLLLHHNIKQKNLISYNDVNADKKRNYIIKQLLLNKKVGLVSDAGSPLISDPGYKLVQECYYNNIKVTHAPGPSAVLNALILSGLPSNQFYFGGFVSSKATHKEKQFLKTKNYKMTGIWFDTSLRAKGTLEIMYKVYGNRKVSIARELTKTYEEIISSELEQIQDLIKQREQNNILFKGEIVIVVDGEKINGNIDINVLRLQIENKLKILSLKDVVKNLSQKTGLTKKFIYNEAIKIKDKM